MTKRVWKGDGTETLEEFFALHRNCNTTMDNGNEIVEGYISPEERRKVERALDAIKSKDPTLLAAIANVRQDDNPDGMMNNFEKAVAYLIPACPVAPNRKPNKSMAHIANVEMKTGRGKTGVEFRFYTDKEYKRLSEDQRLELRNYRAAQSKVSRKTKFERYNKGRKGNLQRNQSGYKRSNFNEKRKGGVDEKKTNFKRLKGAVSEAVVKVIRQDSKTKPNEYIISLVNASKSENQQAEVSSTMSTNPTTSKLLRNNIVKGTSNKTTISACVMKRISYEPYDIETDNRETGSRSEDSPEVEVASLRTFAEQTRTELDSHANMPVFGKHCYIENREEVLRGNRPGVPGCRYATVQGYSPDMEVQELPIVDAAVAFRCPIDGVIKILHFPDSLYCESLNHNLIPPFIMREAGFIVNDVPRIHCNPVTNESHCIVSQDRSLRIPLQLHGVFSYFDTFRPDVDHIQSAEAHEHYTMTPTGWTWNPNSSVYRSAESLHVADDGTLIPNQSERVSRFKEGVLNSVRRGEDAGMEIYEEHEDVPLPPGYVIEISAVNRVMSESSTNLVPESPMWRTINNGSEQDESATETEPESDWENIHPSHHSSFADNLLAREALGQMAMSIGATSTWNHDYLFPNNSCSEDEEDYGTTDLIKQSVAKWSDIPIASSVSSIHASYPIKKEDSDEYSDSSDSFFQIEKDDISVENDDFSVTSHDERKRPAKPSTSEVRRRLEIKMEEDNGEEVTVLSVTPPIPQVNTPSELDVNTFETTFNEVAQPDWIRLNNERMTRPSWVKQDGYDYFESEDEYDTDQEYHSDGKKGSKRDRSQDDTCYFDKYAKRKDDDEDDPPSGSKTNGRSQISPKRYYYQTRQATRRTRSSYKRCKNNHTKSRSVMALKASERLTRKARDPLHGLTPSYASIKSAMIKGSLKKRGIPAERLMRAWKIDRDTAVRTIRATSQRYKRKLDPSMKRNITTSDRQLRYNRINDHLFMDTMFAMANGGKSIRGNTCAQVFTTDKGFIGVNPKKNKRGGKIGLKIILQGSWGSNCICL